MRGQIERILKQLGEQMISFINAHRPPTDEEKDRYLEYDNTAHLEMMSDIKGFRNLFFNKKWKVYISKSANGFVTSDNPVSEIFPKPKGFYGITFLERTHYFALSPDILIELTEPKGNDRAKRKTLFPDQNNMIFHLNAIRADCAEQYVYCKTQSELKELQKLITRSKNPI